MDTSQLKSDRYALRKLIGNLKTLRKYQVSFLKSVQSDPADYSDERQSAADIRRLLRRASGLGSLTGLKSSPPRGAAAHIHRFLTSISASMMRRNVALRQATETTEAHLHAVAAELLAYKVVSGDVRQLIQETLKATEHASAPADRVLVSQT